MHRDRQRASAVGGPPAGRGAGRLVRRPEPPPAHPSVDPGPAVGLEQVRELLVAQQRGHARVLERAQGRGPGVTDVQPGPTQRRQELGPRVGVESRHLERVTHLGDQRLQLLRPGPARRSRPQQVGEQSLVDIDSPRHAGVRHLDRDQGTRRLRRKQQPEPDRLIRCRHGCHLPSVFEVRAQVLGRVVDGEQRRIGLRTRPELVPVLRLLPLQQPHVHRGSPPQHVMAQPEVVAALDPHPSRQQRRVPPSGVVPHPPRRIDLACAHVRRQVGHRQSRAPRHDQPPARAHPGDATAKPGP